MALAGTQTTADRPTTQTDFQAGAADRVRMAAAQALAAIGGNTARAALLAALLDDTAGGASGAIADALIATEGSESAEALGYLLDAEEVNPLTRWLVVQRLTDHPAGEEVMHRSLARDTLDPFTRGALAEGLGQRRALAALPLLRQLAEDHACDSHLRSQAVLALGLLGEPATEITLIRMISDPNDDATLRGLAAEQLPKQLSNEGRRFLRDLLRNERPPAPIVAGALRALGRVGDREALPLLLRYSQDDTPTVAQAAISALIDLGDTSVAPILVRIAQQPSVDQALRLQAVGALLRLGGDGYRPLLRVYLGHGPLPRRSI
jgi:HEAT repeat protein